VDAEYREYQDALAGLKNATEIVNAKRILVINAINKKAAEFGAQVASDTATVPEKPAGSGQ